MIMIIIIVIRLFRMFIFQESSNGCNQWSGDYL